MPRVTGSNKRVGKWSQEEDERLVTAVNELLKQMNAKTQRGIPWLQVSQRMGTRTGKQCRERWVNHLRPGLSADRWSAEEERLLWKLSKTDSGRWVYIASHLKGRSPNQVKLRYRALERKFKRTGRISPPVTEAESTPQPTTVPLVNLQQTVEQLNENQNKPPVGLPQFQVPLQSLQNVNGAKLANPFNLDPSLLLNHAQNLFPFLLPSSQNQTNSFNLHSQFLTQPVANQTQIVILPIIIGANGQPIQSLNPLSLPTNSLQPKKEEPEVNVNESSQTKQQEEEPAENEENTQAEEVAEAEKEE